MSEGLIQKDNADPRIALEELRTAIEKVYENDDDPVLEYDQVFNIKHEIVFSRKNNNNKAIHRFTANK